MAFVGKGEKHKAYRACDIAFGHFHSSHAPFLLLIKACIPCGRAWLPLHPVFPRLLLCLWPENTRMRYRALMTLSIQCTSTQYAMRSRHVHARDTVNITTDVSSRPTCISYMEIRSWRVVTMRVRYDHSSVREHKCDPTRAESSW